VPTGVLVIAVLFHTTILTALGSYLIQAEPPQKADIALVLAGDASGNRILKAAELARQGYVPKVLVSGPAGFYGYHECEFAIPFAIKAGYPESCFIHFEHAALSTKDEALATTAELRRLGAKRIMLVTSDYHSRRAARLFRASAPDLTFNVVAAPDLYFSAGGWWHTREGRKIFVMEWTKTVAERLGL
jgi:uncharacterized SAM-binding protein YcdF (DUF218 family)